MIKRIAIWVSVTIAILLSLTFLNLQQNKRDYFLQRPGEIVDVRLSSPEFDVNGSQTQNIHLISTTGLEVRLRILLPPAAIDGKAPLLLILGGHRTGKHAVDLVDDPQGIAFAAIDYPYDGKQKMSGAWEISRSFPKIQSALLDTPPAIMLAMNWLSEQPWFDAQRVNLAGVSLGVPFAAVAGALDQRFKRVWLIHGASDNYEWLMSAGESRIHSHFWRSAAAHTMLFVANGNSFKTVDWIQQIAPRQTIVIAARNDERVPRSSITGFIDSTNSDFISIIWTEGMHVGPGRKQETQQLLDIVIQTVNNSYKIR